MEMFNHLSTIMYYNKILLLVAMGSMLAFLGCTEKDPVVEKSVVYGTINHDYPHGIKVVLEEVTESSLKYVAISDDNGSFEIRDIVPGTYSIDAIKEGYGWIWMVDDGVVNHTDRLIELVSGQTKEITIYMNGGGSKELELTDISGNPINDRVYIPKYTSTVSFRLFNGTDRSLSFSVSHVEYCSIYCTYQPYTYGGMDIFKSIGPLSGSLNPGEDIVIVGIIDQDFYDFCTESSPNYYYHSLNFYLGGTSVMGRDVLLDFDLGKTTY